MRTEITLKLKLIVVCVSVVTISLLSIPTLGQLTDKTRAPNVAGAGIAKSLADEIGAGRGDVMTPGSSTFIIRRDPFRSIRRGRQLFQRKFTRAQGQGPNFGDGAGDINTDLGIGAGLADSCAAISSDASRVKPWVGCSRIWYDFWASASGMLGRLLRRIATACALFAGS